jgi:hypothetical protein
VQKLKLALKTAPWRSLLSGLAAFGAALVLLPQHPVWFSLAVVFSVATFRGWRIQGRLALLTFAIGVLLSGGSVMSAFLFGVLVVMLAASAGGALLTDYASNLLFAGSVLLQSQAWYNVYLSPASPEGAACSLAFLWSMWLPFAIVLADDLSYVHPQEATRYRILRGLLYWQIGIAVWLLPVSIYMKSLLYAGILLCERGYRLNGNNRVFLYELFAALLLIIAAWLVVRTSGFSL